MRKVVFCALVLVVVALPVLATPVACPISGNVATLIALSGAGNGCLINGLIFNNFTFTPSATGVGVLPVATQVAYTLDNPGTSTGQLIYGFEFIPNLSVLGIGTEDILLSYTIIAPSAIIASIHLLEVAVTTGTATATVAEGPNRACTGVGTGCTFLPTITSTTGTPHQDLLGIGPYTEIDVFKDINVTSTATTGNAAISQVRDSVDLTSAVPEPSTYSFMIGGGLIGLVMLIRRK
jgi:hypothetical protein